MARAVWSGAISFGLVSVPVKAFTAVRDHEVHFHQIDKKSGARIRYQKVAGTTGREVDADEIQLGYEVRDGKYVKFEQKEIDELRPRSTRMVEVTDFVGLDEIDPIYYERTYWLGPDGEAAARAYQLLLAAMESERRVAIGSVVMRNKQYLAAIRPLDGVLAMSTMRFADEVVPREDIDELPARRTKPSADELKLAVRIIDSLASGWKPEQYHDTYTETLRDLIERKGSGEDITPEPEPEEEGGQVLDLMAALQASLEKGRRSGSGSNAKKAHTDTSRAARKPTGKRAAATAAPTKAKPTTAKAAATKKPARKRTTRKSA